jgi:Protein of unknown function (DUF1549)/Protein of unknown function (DUF1553)
MRWLSCLLGCLLMFQAALAQSRSDDLLPPETPLQQAVDHYLEARLQRAGVQAAPPADAATLLRRTMLDLVGRPPTMAEAKAFLESSDPDKRTQLVDRLLASPGFVRQQAAEFDAWLMDGVRGSLRDYLSKAFRERRPWDRMFRELLVGEPDDAQQKGAIRFVAARAKDPDKLTSDTSVLFFGVNVSCAKCHDHPLVADWKQDHYYGMLSFFSRTFDVGEFLGEREYGRVSFKTVEGESRDARLMFLTGTVLEEPPSPEPDDKAKKEERKRLEELKQKKEPPPPPTYSRRAALVEAALADSDDSFFSRAIVNVVWNRFFGSGLVMPLDQMHSENPPSHPELLAWLARDVRSHDFDLTRLIRGIVLSQAYARTSRWDSAGEFSADKLTTNKRPSEELFAVAQVRPLKPWQYGTLLKFAATSPDEFASDGSPDDFDRRLEQLEASGRGLVTGLELPGTNFQVGVEEALLLSNSPKIAGELLADGKSTLLGRLAECADDRAAAELAIWNVYSRPPEQPEVEALLDYLAKRAARPAEARRQMLWALLTSSECRFNY